MSDTGRFAIGSRGSSERRLVERKAIVDAWLTRAVGAVQAELAGGWLGAEHSPLGVEPHRAAVERRLMERAAGDTSPVDAAIVAGRYLLTVDAIADEFFRRAPAGELREARALRALGSRPARNDNGRLDNGRSDNGRSDNGRGSR